MLNRVSEVFTKEYREETAYREFMEKMRHNFELNNNSEDVEKKVKRLLDKNFVSNFRINTGEYK